MSCLITSIQYIDKFVDLLLSLMHIKNADVYVSGSNGHLLSSDIATEFRGRSEEIRLWPLTFAEYYEAVGGSLREAWFDYSTYGGLPQVVLEQSESRKKAYLSNLFESTYLKDLVDNNHIRKDAGIRKLINILASSVGSSSNPYRIVKIFESHGIRVKRDTIKQYLDYLKDSFLIEEAQRYDVRGRKYIGTENKYYFADIGIRSAILNFRQQEASHIMSNIIYCELRSRGYEVDVGMVEIGGKLIAWPP